MRKPKPPTPRSVSATLRTAGFRAIGDGDEGYKVAWQRGDPATGQVHVSFHDYRGDGTAAAVDEAREREYKALTAMGDALRRKGWAVRDRDSLCMYLIITDSRWQRSSTAVPD